MAIPLQISYRDIVQQDALERLITDEVGKLERYFPRIVNCRVHVEHVHGRRGSAPPYHLRIVLDVPGQEIVTNHSGGHASLASAAVHGAFKKAKRQLQEYARLIAS